MTDLYGQASNGRWIDTVDGEGVFITGMVDIDGEYYPCDNGCYERITEAHTFKARKDDIWIAGYPKCGAHWTYDIIKMVLADSAENVEDCKDNNFYEVTPFSEMAAMASPRVLDTHLALHRMPRDVLNKKCKIIYNIRNPKDVVVSYYNHIKSCVVYKYEGTFNGYLKMFLNGRGEYSSWFVNTIGWYEYAKTHPEVLVLKYEDMSKDLPAAVRLIADHIGHSVSDELVEKISHQCDFKIMKQRKKHTEIKEWFKEEDATFYRKGKVGDWKNWFTVTQNEEFDRVFENEMRHTDLEIEFQIPS